MTTTRKTMFAGAAVAALISIAGCSSDPPPNCAVICSTDTDCTDGQTCTATGRCSSEASCPCDSGEFLGCVDATTARFCNSGGTAFDDMSCGAEGCNTDAARCNECVPNESACDGSGMAVQHCGADGLVASTETCALSCSGGLADHCPYISPKWAPDICNNRATEAALSISAATTFDTNLDTNCNGGIIAQTGGPEICVARYGTITVGASTVVTGTRAIALVSDDMLRIDAAIDAAARGGTNGPGGGTVTSGVAAAQTLGGGGAGFRQQGGSGGNATTTGGGGAGGAILDPLTLDAFIGGPRSTSAGGGGAVMLVACRGTVTVSGSIHVGGGGGFGGRDISSLGVRLNGGGGGGAGGYVVLQGTQVNVTATGRFWANGGGGGGGCPTDECVGLSGQDGQPMLSGGTGGGPTSSGGQGGNGGLQTAAPTNGTVSLESPGGGGGSTGRVQIFTPSGVVPVVGAGHSPVPEANQVIPTR